MSEMRDVAALLVAIMSAVVRLFLSSLAGTMIVQPGSIFR